MPASSQIVSGLPDGAPALAGFRARLAIAGLECEPAVLRIEEAGRTTTTAINLIFVLPILGDNDLSDSLRTAIRNVIDSGVCSGRAVMVVLSGDRHISDDVLSVDAPVIVKLNRLFEQSGVFQIDRRKLDADTAHDIAESVARSLAATTAADVSSLEALTRLLAGRPSWRPSERQLDLYCARSGFSLLHERPAVVVCRAATLISGIAPQALMLRGAGLRDSTLEGIAPALAAPCLDLGSNGLTINATAPHLSACRWLSLGANDMAAADVSALPAGVVTLHLHKNLLRDICLVGRRANQFKAISLYRNRLSCIDWPSEQLAIVRLNLGANPLERLPEGLERATQLEWLGVARTRLTRLPEWLIHLPRLREVDVSYMEDVLPAAQLAALRRRGVSLVTRPGYKDAT